MSLYEFHEIGRLDIVSDEIASDDIASEWQIKWQDHASDENAGDDIASEEIPSNG